MIEWGFDNGELVGFETEDEPKEQDDLSDDLKDKMPHITERFENWGDLWYKNLFNLSDRSRAA